MNVFTEKHRKAALVVPTQECATFRAPAYQPGGSATNRAPGRSFPRRGLASTQRGENLDVGHFTWYCNACVMGAPPSTNLHRAKSIRSSGVGMEIFTINADFNVNATHPS